ncbi:hypothetical protein BDN71DRAFT_1510382 [Pleurotus eryngii]|uniref:Uncharacterized protein n=1 Tax=Pleurotus eryngii TaxID=5323 RepID=A0A9P6D3S0_PLEER|nr:hypothetical protein BDN71DRAFT_1510382 [Pleurotus eryngii]
MTPPPDPTQPLVVYTQVPWNPNLVPSPGAVLQTFVRLATTTVIVIPTVTVTITIVGATITVAPGGTPVGGMVPTDVTQPDAVFLTFNWNLIPPSTASLVIFTSGTWMSVISAPTVTDDPVEVDRPPDDGDDDDSNNLWLLLLGLAGLFFLSSIPLTVAIIGGVIPTPGPPPDWVDLDSWLPPPSPPRSNLDPPDDDDDDDNDDDDKDFSIKVCSFYIYTLFINQMLLVKLSVTNNVNTTNAPMQSSINALNTINPNPAGDQIEMYICATGMLGQYLTTTSGLKNTAEKVQKILGHITPATASYLMDTKFNVYFSNLMSQYPQRITYVLYHPLHVGYLISFGEVLSQQSAWQSCSCHTRLLACDTGVNGICTHLGTAGMTWQDHVPASTYHPPCNTAGQTGSFILFYNAVTNVPITYTGDPTFRIVATSVHHFRYARILPSLYTFYDMNLEVYYGNTCAGIHFITEGSVNAVPNPNYQVATWDQDCTGGQGPGLSNLHPINDNGNRMICLFNNFNDGSNTFAIDCGLSQVAIQACIVHVNTVDGVSNAYTSIPFM